MDERLNNIDNICKKLNDKGWNIEADDVLLALEFIASEFEDLTEEDVADLLQVIAQKNNTGPEDTASASSKSVSEFLSVYNQIMHNKQ